LFFIFYDRKTLDPLPGGAETTSLRKIEKGAGVKYENFKYPNENTHPPNPLFLYNGKCHADHIAFIWYYFPGAAQLQV
jgi:hypothetical protein